MIEGPRLLRDFRTIFDSGTAAGLTDAQLLDRFEARRAEAEAAFEALVARHAPMVLGVCRRVLRDPNDVDDAFQATFLVLATRAASIRERASLGGWLARVALRVALRADEEGKRRRAFERRAAEDKGRPSVSSPDREEARAAVDEEVDRLPDRFRRPVVLCYLEGLTHDEAAIRLGCPVGTVRSRLSRARDRLKGRLARRGLAPADLALLAPPHPSASAIEAATRAALRPSTASAAAVLLKKGVLMTMLWARWKRAGLLLFACGSAAVAVSFEAFPMTPTAPSKTAQAVAAVAPVAPGLDEPPAAVPKVAGRVIEGLVVGPDRQPVPGARVFFAQAADRADRVPMFLEAMTATTDASGRYRLDLAPFPSLAGQVRALLLAPGFRATDRTFNAANGPAKVDFELTAQPWKETELRLVDPAGKPVGGVDVNASVGLVTWVRPKTDAKGTCRISMALGVPQQLWIQPEDARPIHTYLKPLEDEPASITITVLPPIRGLVVDQGGRPVPKVAVCQSIFLGADGRGNLGGLPGNKTALTDREGMFTVAPVGQSRSPEQFAESSPIRTQVLCVVDREFHLLAHRTIDPTRAIEPMVVKLGPLRRVHVKIVGGGYPVPTYGWKFFSKVSLAPRPDLPDFRWPLIDRELKSRGVPDGIVVEEDLPEGTYQLEVRHEGQVEQHREVFGKATRELVVTAGEGPLDFPNLYLVSLAFDKLIGKPAPEIDAADHDTGQPVKLADYRGKVILLAFGGYEYLLSDHVTHLIDLQRKFAGRPLAIIALHDQSLNLRAEHDRRFARLQSEKAIKAWRGFDLPFRVLKDRPDPEKPEHVKPEGQGTTIKRYDVRSLPTVLLIDHDGKVVAPVAYHDHDRLESLVRTLVEKAEATRTPVDPKPGTGR